MFSDVRYHGVYRGTVVATNDPQNLGRVTLNVPQVSGTGVTNWAWPLLAGYIPESGEACWVTFEGGDPNFPLWLKKYQAPIPAAPSAVPFTVAGGTLGTQPTFDGTPLFTGTYTKHGVNVHFTIDVDMDNITNFGTGQYYVDLPFPSKHNYQFASGCLHDISTGRDYPIFGHVLAGQSRLTLKSVDAQGNTAYNVEFTSTNPVTLAVADNFHISGNYIADES
jgi:hypothetical protein